ncbi:amidase family protein [Streptomyces sp. NBC_01515]|uniref:hypothetical protein n=1 Tax=Streptomyces sp. NBC_01515 TaxID=2903890 RepID=UPI00386E025D
MAELIRARQVSAGKVLRECLERIDGIDPRLNSIVTVLADQAVAAARAADEAVAAGDTLGRGVVQAVGERRRVEHVDGDVGGVRGRRTWEAYVACNLRMSGSRSWP